VELFYFSTVYIFSRRLAITRNDFTHTTRCRPLKSAHHGRMERGDQVDIDSKVLLWRQE
jgi:hypothetical protein